jgi:murein DD-endopeptidase MepM/ murein hydrolase activator NlpD
MKKRWSILSVSILAVGLLGSLGGVGRAGLLDSDPTDPSLPEDPVGTVLDTVEDLTEPEPSPSTSPSPSPQPTESAPPPPATDEETDEALDPIKSGDKTVKGIDKTASANADDIFGAASSPDAMAPTLSGSGAHEWRPLDEPQDPYFYRMPRSPRSTRLVLQILNKINAPLDVVANTLAPFPVAGPAHYSDDWGADRHFPTFHRHEGTDIFADRGTPVIASSDGVITDTGSGSSIGGNEIKLTGSDGTYYIYSHLDSFGPGIEKGSLVSAGDIIGSVGTTGNAGRSPHLHFEIHPDGGAAIPPVPYLDRWLSEALHRAKALQSSSANAGATAGLSGLPRQLADRIRGAVTSPDGTSIAGVSSALAGVSWLMVLGSVGLGLYIRRRIRMGATD